MKMMDLVKVGCLFAAALFLAGLVIALSGCTTPTEYTETAEQAPSVTTDGVPIVYLHGAQAEAFLSAYAKGPKTCGGPQPVCTPPEQQTQAMCWNDKKQVSEPCGCYCFGWW